MTSQRTTFPQLLLILGWLASGWALPSAATGLRLTTRESVIARLNFTVDRKSVVFSPDARHVAYVTPRGGERIVSVDGVELGVFSVVNELNFAPTGSTLAFWASRDQRGWIIGGTNRYPLHRGYAHESLRFSADGRSLAWVAEVPGDRLAAFVNGRAEPAAYDKIAPLSLQFSPDGTRLAYAVTNEGSCFVVMGGKPGPAFEDVGFPVFHPSGGSVAYPAKRGGRWRMIRGDQEVGDYPSILNPSAQFSPDGSRLAYVVERDGRFVVVDEGRESGGIETLGQAANGRCLFFSPDSRRLAWIARKGAEVSLWLDGAAATTQTDISADTVTFSPDSRRWAAAARDSKDGFAVVNGEPGRPYEHVCHLRFSPDSRHLVHGAARYARHLIVVDGVEGPEFDDLSDIVFDGPASFHFLARRTNEMAQEEIILMEVTIVSE